MSRFRRTMTWPLMRRYIDPNTLFCYFGCMACTDELFSPSVPHIEFRFRECGHTVICKPGDVPTVSLNTSSSGSLSASAAGVGRSKLEHDAPRLRDTGFDPR
jgi:hypothetical protein